MQPYYFPNFDFIIVVFMYLGVILIISTIVWQTSNIIDHLKRMLWRAHMEDLHQSSQH